LSASVATGLPALYPRLWRYCLALTGARDHAQDLAQAACVRALEKAHLFESGTRLDFWVFRLTQRLWLNELRARAVRRQGGIVPLDEVELPSTNPDPEMNIFARQVFSQVMGLPEAQRSTILLVYVEGLTYKEAADIMEVPIGTIMSRLAAARQKINDGSNKRKDDKTNLQR
jgi:RNA polymerase sigma-70 factor, ECF subfamily